MSTHSRPFVLAALLALLLAPGLSQAQDVSSEQKTFDHAASSIDAVFIVVQQMPVLIGGLETLQAEVNQPSDGCPASSEGRVFLEMVVDKEGNVNDPRVVKSLSAGCDAEALRAVSGLSFEPGLQGGQRVNVKFSLPVTFGAN